MVCFLVYNIALVKHHEHKGNGTIFRTNFERLQKYNLMFFSIFIFEIPMIKWDNMGPYGTVGTMRDQDYCQNSVVAHTTEQALWKQEYEQSN